MNAPQRLRIALLTPGFSAGEQDWCIPVQLDFVRCLAQHHDVTVFPLRYPHHRRTYRVFGAQVIPCGGAEVRGVRRLLLFRQVLKRVTEQHRSRPFDVLHALWAHEPGYLAVRAARRLDIPSVVSIMGGELADVPEANYGGLREPANRWLALRSLGRADRVTVGSIFNRRQAESFVETPRLVNLPFGVDIERFHPLRPPGEDLRLDGSPCLVHAASLVPIKDQATLLRAFATVQKTMAAARLHILGDGPLRGELETLAQQLCITQHIRWHGDIAHDRLPAFFRASDLGVVTSYAEAYPMVVLEAGACGTPSLGTAVGKLPELVDRQLLVEPGDAEGLAKRLLEACCAPENLANRGKNLRRKLETELSIDRQASRFAALYFQLSHDRQRPEG